MKVGDLVKIKDHPEHTGLVLNIYDEDGFEWIKVQWLVSEQGWEQSMHALNHLEVIG